METGSKQGVMGLIYLPGIMPGVHCPLIAKRP